MTSNICKLIITHIYPLLLLFADARPSPPSSSSARLLHAATPTVVVSSMHFCKQVTCQSLMTTANNRLDRPEMRTWGSTLADFLRPCLFVPRRVTVMCYYRSRISCRKVHLACRARHRVRFLKQSVSTLFDGHMMMRAGICCTL